MRFDQRFKGGEGTSHVAPGQEYSKQRKQSKGHVWETARRLLEGIEQLVKEEERVGKKDRKVVTQWELCRHGKDLGFLSA